MKKYVVTGGAGFIGSNLVDRLINDGHQVIIIDNLSGSNNYINEGAKLCEIDIATVLESGKIIDTIRGCDGIFHLAALTKVQESIENPYRYNEQNVGGLLNVLLWAKEAGIRRVIHSSSSAVYGNVQVFPTTENEPTSPLSPYGLNKLIGEEYCKLFSLVYGVETVSLRYFNAFGERQPITGSYCSVIGTFINQHKNNIPMTVVGDGLQERDFTYVKDIAEANILAMNSDKVGMGECINVGSGESKSVNQIANIVGGDIEYIENRVEPRISLADNTKAKNLLNWKPTVTVEDWIPGYKKELGL